MGRDTCLGARGDLKESGVVPMGVLGRAHETSDDLRQLSADVVTPQAAEIYLQLVHAPLDTGADMNAYIKEMAR
jgi:hypothetical protein